MKIKRTLCILLACFLLLPFTVTAESTYNEAFRLQLFGDVDGSGDVTTTDARLTLQYVVGKVGAEEVDTRLADVDGDGALTTTDARLILQYTVGKEGVALYTYSLPYTKRETPPAGEPVPFALMRATDVRFYNSALVEGRPPLPIIAPRGDSFEDRFVLIQTAEEWAQVAAWHILAPDCDETFFEENALLLCDVLMNDYGCVLEVEEITRDGATLACHLLIRRLPIGAADAMYPAFGVIQIPKDALADAENLAVMTEYRADSVEE